MDTLKAEKRSMAEKAKKLRREGYVVGSIFGKKIEASIPVQIEKQELDRLLKTSEKGSQIMVDVDGTSYNVLIKDVVFNPLKGRVDDIEFQALVSDEKVHSVAEIHLINHDKLVGGVLQQNLEEVAYKAYPADLVDKIEIDVAELRVGDTIKVSDLAIAQNAHIDLTTNPETVVVTLGESHNAVAEDEEGEETAE